MKDQLVLLARLLALAWSALWLFFFVAEPLATNTPFRLALPWVGLGVLFVILSVAAWRWEVTGGAMLSAVGFLVAVLYLLRPPEQLPLPGRITTALFFGVPPLAAGALFLVHHRLAIHRS
jgi:hypothetical protein